MDYVYPTQLVVSEAKTINNYLDQGEIVQRIHHELPEQVMNYFSGFANGIEVNPGMAEGIWCTCQTYNLFYDAYKEAGYTEEEAGDAAGRIIYYTFPEESSPKEIKKSGAQSYDRFYKNNDKYYHSKYTLGNDQWTEVVTEIKDFDNYFSTEQKE